MVDIVSSPGESQKPNEPRIKLDYATIVAIQKSLDQIDTGHGSVTIDVSQFQLVKIRYEVSALLVHKPKKPGI